MTYRPDESEHRHNQRGRCVRQRRAEATLSDFDDDIERVLDVNNAGVDQNQAGHGDVFGTLTELLRFVAATARLAVGGATRPGEIVVHNTQGDGLPI